MNLKAIFFDQDGVIIDTEKFGHRVAFNQAFREFDYGFEWDIKKYYNLLQIAGGKERIKRYFQDESLFPDLSDNELNNLIQKLHNRKTEIFINLIESGKLPLRAGVKRLMKEARDRGLILGVCTTANERTANTIVNNTLGDIVFEFVIAGDAVSKKKPDPEIYLLALDKCGLPPDKCIVIEDSRNGLLAAKSACLKVLITTNLYTEYEDFSEASIVVTSLGDPNGEKGVLKASDKHFEFDGVLNVDNLLEYFES